MHQRITSSDGSEWTVNYRGWAVKPVSRSLALTATTQVIHVVKSVLYPASESVFYPASESVLDSLSVRF